MDKNTIQKDIRDITDKWIGKQNSDHVRSNIKYEIRHYLDDLIDEGIINGKINYQIDIQCRDKDTINLRIIPDLKFNPIIIKHIYTGPTNGDFINGNLYDIYFDRFTLIPLKIDIGDVFIQGHSEIHKQYFSDLISSGILVQLSQFREDRINQILED
jgi:hypothetical protein